MGNPYSDAQLIWPTEGTSNCSTEYGTPIFPNTTGTSICGLRNNRTVAESCCRGLRITEVQDYQCWHYCETTLNIFEWAQCIGRVTNIADQSSYPYAPFCQSALIAQTSASHRSSTPKISSWIVLALIFGFLFIGPTQATIVHSLGDGLAKRQSTGGCTFNVSRTYASEKHGTQAVTNIFAGFPGAGSSLTTPLGGNNRTINSTSAAGSEFDDFFDVVSKATNGRRYPAMSSVELKRDVALTYTTYNVGPNFYLGWTPISVFSNI